VSDGSRTFYLILKNDGEIRANHRLAKKYRHDLDKFDVFDYRRRGKIEWLIVRDHEILDIQIHKKFPRGLDFKQDGRLGGILTSRDSKKGGRASKVPAIMRFITNNSDESLGFPALELTNKNGIVALLVDLSNNYLMGKIVIVENFDCFLHAESFVEYADVIIYASGKLDSRLLTWINESEGISELVHMGDYDPVGLSEFCRIDSNCRQSSTFYLPSDIDIEIFKQYGKSSLVSDRNNSKTLEKVRSYETNDLGFNKTLEYILETGLGLEQEYILLHLMNNA